MNPLVHTTSSSTNTERDKIGKNNKNEPRRKEIEAITYQEKCELDCPKISIASTMTLS